MNKALLFFLSFATTTALAASELTTTDEPEAETNTLQSAAFKSAGIASSFKSSQRVFLRDGVKVAALITRTESIGNHPPTVRKFIECFIDSENRLEINLGDPRIFSSRFVTEVTVAASEDSITVTAPKKGYCEIFFKSNGTFMDGAQREQLARGYLNGVSSPR